MKRISLKRISLVVVLLAILGAAGFWAAGFVGSGRVPYFEDKTPGSGVDFTNRNGEAADYYTVLETLGGGVALIDYDQDGQVDIFLTGGGDFGLSQQILGHANRLFRNEGNWRFRDVTVETGLPGEGTFYSQGCAVGDFNNDGWPDLLVTGYGRLALYQNHKGKFVEVTRAAGLLDERPLHWSTSAAWGDLDGNGFLDLFVCHYVDWSFANHPKCPPFVADKEHDNCPPEKFKPLAQAVFLNQGDGTFKEVAPSAGIVPAKGLGVLVFDADNDGKLDVYVASDGTGNYLYLNKGDGKFEESAVVHGVAYSMTGTRNGSMGVAAADYNHTGLASLFVTNYQDQAHALYRNLGNGQFQNSELASGLIALGYANVGFGTCFFDFDLDGSEDLFIVNGHVARYPKPPSTSKQRPSLLRNLFKGKEKAVLTRFEIVGERGGPYFAAEHMGRGAACGDLDNDGGPDLVVSHINEPVALLRNQVPQRGHWLGVALVGKPCRDAIGAKLTLEVDGQTLTRFVLGGGSYLSSSDPRIVFGREKPRRYRN